jgi:quinoprotein glucose dehydrogenase
MSVDPERGLVFAPTTNPSPDFYGVRRSTFDIPLSDATVAISAATGQPVWHFQTTRHDLFDFDLPGHPLLVDILRRGQRVPVAIQQTKLGRVFVLDRETGKPLFPVEERAAPRSDIPGERSAPTQPFPTLPEPFARQTISRDDMWGLTWFDRAWCRREFDKLRYEGPYTPPSERGSIIFPFGGGNWGGVAYDKTNNLLIAKGQNLALRVRLIRKDAKEIDADGKPLGTDLVGTPYRAAMGLFVSPLGLPCTPPPFGTLSAIDLDTGKLRWQVPLGQARYRGITAPAAFDWGSPNIGGPMVTAGGLVFVAAAMDKQLRAFDVKTGVELWSHELPAPGMAVPMTYESGGRQYVVIAAGGNARVSPELADAIVAFTLPKNSAP